MGRDSARETRAQEPPPKPANEPLKVSFPFGASLPERATVLVTQHLPPLLSVPSNVTLDMPAPKQLELLSPTDQSQQVGIVLMYAQPLPTNTSTRPDESPQAYFGMYCHVAAVLRQKQSSRLELALVPHIRVKLKEGQGEPAQFANMDIEPWPYAPLDAADLNDIVVAAMPLLPNLPVLPTLGPLSVDPTICELVLHRLCGLALEKVGKFDLAGIRPLIERAFVERDFHFKLDLIQNAFGRLNIANEMHASIEESNTMRKLAGMEQQMDRMARQQLTIADPNSPMAENDADAKLTAQIAALTNPKVKEIATRELRYLKQMEPGGSEYGNLATYLDWLVNFPWDKLTKDRFDMQEAQRILDESHFGLDDVKTKIMQLLANASRTGKIAAKPLLFVGPPGTGKTSFAKSIAEALGRKFISLAGLTESTDLRGHRRTYASSLPGKIVSELRKCGSRNPVVVFDEVDKIEDSHRHKPIMPALLELLSPDQNKTFFDHYLDASIDCSEVLFICTANSTDTISSPLLNRLHVVELRAYSAAEKIEIAQKYLLPQSLAESGLSNVSLSEDAIRELIFTYSRFEAGVRQVRRHMQRLMRKVAYQVVTDESATQTADTPIAIDKEMMLSMLEAPERAHGDRIYDVTETPVGVVNGLAKNMYGGSTLTIEAIIDLQKTGPINRAVDGEEGAVAKKENSAEEDDKFTPRPGIEFTGNIMDTMKESSSIAYTYAKLFMTQYFPKNAFFKTAALHVHVPFAQVKKDGPSAGCALVCAYLSVALGKAISPTLCMTGEITLNGRVTAVGGIREKVTAAVQNGMTDVIIPLQNQADFEAIPADLVANIKPHFVDTFEQAFEVVFAGLSLTTATTASTSPPAAQKIVVTSRTPELGRVRTPKPAQTPIIEAPKQKRSRTPVLNTMKDSL